MEDFGGMGAGQLPLASPKLALHRALQYAVEFWPYVMNVLEDGHLELSNNVAEQAQRIFVVGRKNWLFSDAPRGARASAAIYSVTTTAKANGLNPRLYVEWLLTEMPNAGELTDEVVDSFLPWSDRVPESCKLDPAAAEKCLCSISCCGFSHDDFSGLGRACRPRNGLNWMVLVSPPERTGKDYDQHAPSTVYPSFAAERGIPMSI